MPRAYRLDRRAIQMTDTRARIVQAAVELYTEHGRSATTLKDVGRRADVAPGTLRRHFRTRDDLDAAIVERATAEMPLPGLDIFDDAQTLADRVARLVMATGVFLDQGTPWYRMWLREPMIDGPWAEVGARYGARWDELIRRALGPLVGDAEALAVLRATLEPTFFEAVRSGSRSTDETAASVASLVTPWLEARVRSLRRRDQGGALRASAQRQR
jgi:AcrR family transcriptional regulator